MTETELKTIERNRHYLTMLDNNMFDLLKYVRQLRHALDESLADAEGNGEPRRALDRIAARHRNALGLS